MGEHGSIGLSMAAVSAAEGAPSEPEFRGLDAPVAPRAEIALQQAKDYGDFRAKRKFKFIHLFAGKVDVLKEQLLEVAKKEGLVVEVESVDILGESGGDLTKEEPYARILSQAVEGDFDGGHSGFPCGSFSRARYNASGLGPPPVGSLRHIYGLPTNTVAQQAEADKGTVLAVRSAQIIGAIIKKQGVRMVSQVGTLENPPGSEDQSEGPAWRLSELIRFVELFHTRNAFFNTCAFQQDLKVRWFKPGRFTGCLNGLENLGRKCTCLHWVVHEALVGKQKTAKAAQYPKELCKVCGGGDRGLQAHAAVGVVEEPTEGQEGCGVRGSEEVDREQGEEPLGEA